MKVRFLVVLMIVTFGCWAMAQQPKADPKPVTLSAEASQQWIEAQRQINELQLNIDKLRLQQQLLAARAGAPEGYVPGTIDNERRVIYVPTPKAEAAKASQ